MNYANIACTSTNKTSLNRILGKQKRAARIMSSDGISYPIKAFNERIKYFECIPNKHSTTSFIYVQSQKQHNSQSIQPSIFFNRSLISNKIF